MNYRIAKTIIKGILTFIPGFQRPLPKGKTGGSNSAYYCYGVWLKHLTLLWENGYRSLPVTVAALGPGDSIGTGLAALLSGANNYYALDVKKYSKTDTTLKIFDERIPSIFFFPMQCLSIL